MQIEALDVAAYRVPTDSPESNGTFSWDATTLVLVEAAAGGRRGLGYTYSDAGAEAMNVPSAFAALVAKVRNAGRPGLCATAISEIGRQPERDLARVEARQRSRATAGLRRPLPRPVISLRWCLTGEPRT